MDSAPASGSTSTAPAAPASAAAPERAPSGPLSDAAAAERLVSLWDNGAFDGPGQDSREKLPAVKPPQSSDSAGQDPAETGTAPEGPAESVDPADASPGSPVPPGSPQTTDKNAGESHDFDAWMADQQIDPGSLSLKVKVDGKEGKATVAELVKAYELSQAGHTRMAEVAKVKQAFEQERTAAIQLFQQRATALEAVGKQLENAYLAPFDQQIEAATQAGDRGWQALAIQQKRDATEWFANNLRSITQARDQQALAQRQQAMPQELEKMLTARPEWRESSRLHADHAAAREFGRSLGFTDADFAGISDHRHILVLHGAAQAAAAQQAATAALGRSVSLQDVVSMAIELHKLQASAPEVRNRLAAATVMSKPGARASAPRDPQSTAYQAARQQAKKSGYQDDDAAALLERMFA